MTIKTINYQFHHIGIPTEIPQPGERYSSTFKMYTSGGENSEYRVQYHRFEPDCPLHPLIKTKTHVAFKVDSIAAAIAGKEVILEPYEPFPGFKVAMIAEYGTPIELIETTLSEEDIWYADHKNSVIYPEIE
ncbi:VOC family protein [Legionella micdadei]|uniref:Uncharacterized protein n=1 Tax=Legionella micdadei TaxID=451 RepID=A0A098GK89_LEGMI|nr:glyoxalase/bleomycin resistance/dioxygenase family protein [Legionella micdadei]ARG96694.1 glyoxalase/bleomycin resistance/dioxygenase family protein [Legionella micdadei]ARG99441.1 glyoxalase/bleomycin resistance/dioxygenase family protein [Legionella micdadei]KTD26359.1 hypothetical protein Lmic_2453 [Legionella micdadei]CEG61926.1 conserved protein of unknown function [Legionella micdadei]SCY66979.1 hypothetical protein SAMN02982997_02438 [Legionella micdadei]